MDIVAMAGDLTLLRWLHKAGTICTTDAMDGAAMNGHLNVVVFLHEARSEGIAGSDGHADIGRFRLPHQSEG
ncbi:hypothetical protein SPRG_15944, partial [Saprolegnia parasitica CBS 223.65]